MRGNRYLRARFVQAAWVVLVRVKCWERYGLKSWIEAAKKRDAPSSASRRRRRRADPLDPRAVLGAVKARPGSGTCAAICT